MNDFSYMNQAQPNNLADPIISQSYQEQYTAAKRISKISSSVDFFSNGLGSIPQINQQPQFFSNLSDNQNDMQFSNVSFYELENIKANKQLQGRIIKSRIQVTVQLEGENIERFITIHDLEGGIQINPTNGTFSIQNCSGSIRSGDDSKDFFVPEISGNTINDTLNPLNNPNPFDYPIANVVIEEQQFNGGFPETSDYASNNSYFDQSNASQISFGPNQWQGMYSENNY